MDKMLMQKYRTLWQQPPFRNSLCLSILAVMAGLVVNNFAIRFATERMSNSVTDIVLSNTPALPVNNLFIYGTFLAIAVSIIVAAHYPREIPFALNATALFFIIRSIFLSLTHFAPFTSHVADDFGTIINNAFFGGDLFFSGHTGLPFLGALMLWHVPTLRYFYLGMSVFFGALVLLGHIHYSIDVASAFFITYGIYHIAIWLFPKSYSWFRAEEARM
ncbi:sphingomyelin synthase family protein [Patescibacteria group bacterium]|nr:sphingomyelin synthase family protein [Patescibacteria group bacterium]